MHLQHLQKYHFNLITVPLLCIIYYDVIMLPSKVRCWTADRKDSNVLNSCLPKPKLFKALFFAHQAIISQDHAPACIRMPIIYNSQQMSYLILSPQYFSMKWKLKFRFS